VARREDRRVQRTRQLLRAALFSLIQEKGFETLSVQDIIDRANVGRATFYAHFENKEDLLLAGFDELQASLRERQRTALSHGRGVEERVLAFSAGVFAHANEHRDLFRAMVGKQSGAVIQQVLHKMLVDLVRDDVRAVAASGVGSVPREALVQLIAGSLFGLLVSWLDGKVRMAVEEIDTLFRRFAIPAMNAVLRAR
jgi:AcrR family transcriptional regulator